MIILLATLWVLISLVIGLLSGLKPWQALDVKRGFYYKLLHDDVLMYVFSVNRNEVRFAHVLRVKEWTYIHEDIHVGNRLIFAKITKLAAAPILTGKPGYLK